MGTSGRCTARELIDLVLDDDTPAVLARAVAAEIAHHLRTAAG